MIADYEILLRTHSHGYVKGDKYFFFIKGDKYLFFIKVGVTNVLLKLNYLQSRVDTIEKYHVFQTKQYQTFHRKIKCDSQILEGYKMGATKIFNI